MQQEDRVQRAFNYAIIDESDSILIDEARISLIIAGTLESHVSNQEYWRTDDKQLVCYLDLFDQ